MSTINISPVIANIISADKATLVQLQSTLSACDLYDLVEIMAVEAHNERAWRCFLENKA